MTKTLNDLTLGELRKVAMYYNEHLKIENIKLLSKKKLLKKLDECIRVVDGRVYLKNENVGDGFFGDLKDKVVNTVSNVFSRISDRWTKNSQNILNKYGNDKIFKIYAFRQPLNKIVESAVKVISLGKFDPQKHGFDKMYHLGLLVKLENGTDIVIEKNETPAIFVGKAPSNSELREIPISDRDITINKMLDKLLEKVSKDQIFLYSGLKNNCQQFVKDILQSNNMWNNDLDKFIYQDLTNLKKDLPSFTGKIMDGVTNIANVGKKLIGQGEPEFLEYLENNKDLVKTKKDAERLYKVWLSMKK